MMHNSAWYKNSAQKALAGRYWLCVLVALVASLLGGAASMPTFNVLTFRFSNMDTGASQFWHMLDDLGLLQLLIGYLVSVGTLASLYSVAIFILGGAIEQGHDLFNVALFTGDPVSLSMLFSRMGNFGRALGLRLLMALKVLAWGLLLIVPGIIASFRYALAPYLMAEYPEMGASEAIEKSKALMQGKKWQLFCLYVSFIGWYLLCGLTFGIGMIFLAPYVKAAETAFYLDVSNRMAA